LVRGIGCVWCAVRWAGGGSSVPGLQGSRAPGLQGFSAPGLQRSLGTPAWGAKCSAGQGPVFAALRCIRAMRPTAAAAYMAWPTDGTGTYRSVQQRSSAAAACGSPIESLHLGLGAWMHGYKDAWMHGCRRVVASLCMAAAGQSSALADLSTRQAKPGPDRVGRAEGRAEGRLFNTGKMHINSSSLTTAIV
jgi:hypothetical protein